MKGKSVAVKTVLTALFIEVAIWSTLGPPPHRPEATKEATKRQFAGPP